MKILLFGEFSGLFNSIRDGLVALGHEVVMASDGNGHKNYPRDLDWYADPKYGKFKHAIELSKIFKFRKQLTGFDAVLLIHPFIFSRYRFIIKPLFDFLINNNKKVFLSGAGMTPTVLKYWYNSNEKYHNYVVGNIKDVPSYSEMLKPGADSWELELLDRINGYIPIWYEYAQPFKNHPKYIKTVRIPINLDKFTYHPNTVGEKVVFLHGVPTRPNAKGTALIKEAFARLKQDYGDVAEFICEGGLPFDEYMKIVNRTNVILDDANSCSVAMNGLFSMASGKIVMGGAEPIANKELGIENVNPVINLCPDVDQIYSCCKDIIEHRDKIEELGLQSRKFVEQYHDYRDIARQYVEIFEKY